MPASEVCCESRESSLELNVHMCLHVCVCHCVCVPCHPCSLDGQDCEKDICTKCEDNAHFVSFTRDFVKERIKLEQLYAKELQYVDFSVVEI